MGFFLLESVLAEALATDGEVLHVFGNGLAQILVHIELGQYLAKLYVDKYLGQPVPGYMKDLAIGGKGLSENAFQ